MKITAEQVQRAINAIEEERDVLHLINCASYQADSEYIENCIQQRFTEQKG